MWLLGNLKLHIWVIFVIYILLPSDEKLGKDFLSMSLKLETERKGKEKIDSLDYIHKKFL